MPVESRRSSFLWVCFLSILLTLTLVGNVRANPLVGLWEPAADQPNERVAQMVEQLGLMKITPTHLEAFGESPVAYQYEQNGQLFRITVDDPEAAPVDFILSDPNTLLTRFPDNMDVLWTRSAAAAAEAPAADSPFTAIASEIAAMAMPHSQPTRYEVVKQSLETLLNNGWSIAHASGTGPAMGLVLKRENQHVICVLMGDLQHEKTGRSDCRRLN